MMKSPDLLRDRHLDHITMCNIYVLSKVSVFSLPPSFPPSLVFIGGYKVVLEPATKGVVTSVLKL